MHLEQRAWMDARVRGWDGREVIAPRSRRRGTHGGDAVSAHEFREALGHCASEVVKDSGIARGVSEPGVGDVGAGGVHLDGAPTGLLGEAPPAEVVRDPVHLLRGHHHVHHRPRWRWEELGAGSRCPLPPAIIARRGCLRPLHVIPRKSTRRVCCQVRQHGSRQRGRLRCGRRGQHPRLCGRRPRAVPVRQPCRHHLDGLRIHHVPAHPVLSDGRRHRAAAHVGRANVHDAQPRRTPTRGRRRRRWRHPRRTARQAPERGGALRGSRYQGTHVATRDA